ncbi:MAG: adenosylhomocysteinase [Actinomycetaceae bacterium]|nr:adenosylhomocysteinase [Actinomycetaceae bacterium]
MNSHLHAQVLLRRFAAATNLLICGRTFLIDEGEATSSPHTAGMTEVAAQLAALLRGLGGRPYTSAHDIPPGTPIQAVFHLDGAQLAPPAAPPPAPPAAPPPALPGAQRTSDTAPAPCAGPRPALATVHVYNTSPIAVTTANGTPLTDPYAADAAPARERIAWARTHMPVTSRAVADLKSAAPSLQDLRIGLSLVLEPKTAVLALLLAEAGADVSVFGHANEVRADVADELRTQGLAVFADPHATREEEAQLAQDFLARSQQILLDDGSHLIRRAHQADLAPTALATMIGAAEETTSGLRPLRTMEADLRIPVVASNDARSKTLFDNAYGTGQSCLFTTLDLLDPDGRGVDLRGKRVVVAGYGDVGRGFARLVRALGADSAVAELDPVRALQAQMDGCTIGELTELAASADWIVSATGVADTISLEVLQAARDGAVIFVIGGVDGEVAWADAVAAGATWEEDPRRAVEHLWIPTAVFPRDEGGAPLAASAPDKTHANTARRLTILDRGECLNCTAGEGNPIEIMDLSFAVQVAALRYLLTASPTPHPLPPGLHPLPVEADNAVAAAALTIWNEVQ